MRQARTFLSYKVKVESRPDVGSVGDLSSQVTRSVSRHSHQHHLHNQVSNIIVSNFIMLCSRRYFYFFIGDSAALKMGRESEMREQFCFVTRTRELPKAQKERENTALGPLGST